MIKSTVHLITKTSLQYFFEVKQEQHQGSLLLLTMSNLIATKTGFSL
jgi:hypothetical protein